MEINFEISKVEYSCTNIQMIITGTSSIVDWYGNPGEIAMDTEYCSLDGVSDEKNLKEFLFKNVNDGGFEVKEIVDATIQVEIPVEIKLFLGNENVINLSDSIGFEFTISEIPESFTIAEFKSEIFSELEKKFKEHCK